MLGHEQGLPERDPSLLERVLIPNHKREATDKASSMESLPTREAMTDLVISERRFGSALKKRGIGRVESISDLQLIHAMPFA